MFGTRRRCWRRKIDGRLIDTGLGSRVATGAGDLRKNPSDNAATIPQNDKYRDDRPPATWRFGEIFNRSQRPSRLSRPGRERRRRGGFDDPVIRIVRLEHQMDRLMDAQIKIMLTHRSE